MDHTFEKQLEAKVAATVRRRGLNIVTQGAPFLRFRPRPDFIVGRSGKYVALEVKARAVMLSDVSQAAHYRHHGQVGTLLCVPGQALSQIPTSVRSYAEQVNIRICGTDEVAEVLEFMLA
jgi:hypothetical protein